MRILDPSITAPAATMARIYRVRRTAAAHLLLAAGLLVLGTAVALTQTTGLVAATDGYRAVNSATLIVVLSAAAAVWVVADVWVCIRTESRALPVGS